MGGNATLDFDSIESLTASLDLLPGETGLTRAPMAVDQIALDIAARDAEVRKVARNRGDVRAAVGLLPDPRLSKNCRRRRTRSWC